MNKNFVFYGPANHGKSTLMGYLLINVLKIDENKYEKFLKKSLQEYNPDLFYSWFVNRQDLKITVHELNNLTGERITVEKFNRSSKTINYNYRGCDIEVNGNKLRISFFDTPGTDKYHANREKAIMNSEVGIFCIEISEVLKDTFDEKTFQKLDVWSNMKESLPIIVLTKNDLNNHLNEADYIMATKKIKSYYGVILDELSIVPTIIKATEKSAVNVMKVDKVVMPWYNGFSLFDTIKKMI